MARLPPVPQKTNRQKLHLNSLILAGSCIPLLEHFDGSHRKLRDFFKQSCLLFLLCPCTYPVDQTKVVPVVSPLTGEPLNRVSHLVEQDSPILTSWDGFFCKHSTIFVNSEQDF
uniref:DUF4939 domain-containing protein n=1 Tax=Gopherus evgoodei TaxID=1825980 RepID=A0A8C4WI06_9SAUR